MARQCPKLKRKRDATWFRDKVLLVDAQGSAYQADDLDAYDSDCDDFSTTKAVFLANFSSYGSDVLFEVPRSENTHNDMLNQSVQEMSYSEQTHVNYPPMLYDGSVIAKETNVISIADSEETLMLKKESQSKMLLKQSDPKVLEKKVNIKPINYAELNRLSEDFGKCFVPQQELFDEQAFRLQISRPNTDQSASLSVKIEAPRELSKIYMRLNIYTHARKLVAVTPINKKKIVRFADPVASSSNIPNVTNRPSLSSIGVKPSTNASRSKPLGNTKNDRISRLPMFSALCSIFNECMFDADHAMCLINHVNSMNVRAQSASKKNKNRKKWKPAGKVFNSVGYKWKPIGRTFTLGDLKYLKKSLPIAIPKVAKSKTANKMEPGTSRGSDTSVAPSYSSLIDCSQRNCQGYWNILNLLTLDHVWNLRMKHPTVAIRNLKTQIMVVERRNRTLVEVARTMLIYAKAPFISRGRSSAYQLTAMASEQSSLEPALHEMILNPHLGIVQNPPPSAPFVLPLRHQWDLVLQPVFDEIYSPSASVVKEAPAPVKSIGSPSSTKVDQDTSSPSTLQTTPQSQSQEIPLSAEEESHDLEVAHMSNDPYFSIPILETNSKESSHRSYLTTLDWYLVDTIKMRIDFDRIPCSLVLETRSRSDISLAFAAHNEYDRLPEIQTYHVYQPGRTALFGLKQASLPTKEQDILAGSSYRKAPSRSSTDADHTGYQDTRRSTSRSMQLLGDRLVSCVIKKQKSAALKPI
ncbi:hypothetical protein Tco_0862544 [Tanacetum coccineum]